MDKIIYKDHEVQITTRAAHDGGFIWIDTIDGEFIGPLDSFKTRRPTANAACQEGMEYAKAVIDGATPQSH